MKAKHVIIYTLSIILSTACIRDEAPNAEADIVSCSLPGVIMTTNPIINNNSVTLFVAPGTDLTTLAPEFTLTPGAKIAPVGGTERDFHSPQTYTVTAADGFWKKLYSVSVVDTELATNYNFEDTLGGQKYYIFVEREGGKVVMQWASGNAGYALTGVPKTADNYPTFQITGGTDGKCLSLVTRSTGFFGQMVGMPIAAGNLFIGSFDVNNAMSNPLKATKFGLPFRHVPTYLAGYYKYKAGSQFTEGGKPVNGKRDICDIYAIMYETSETVSTLDGTNAFTSPNLVSMARINDAKETDEWTYFKLPFTPLPGKFIDKEKLQEGKYNISIVFSSSLEGDHFNGAIGSNLQIDQAELIYHSEN
ncbi:PCMD domain-containing protein [Bacteroides sp.]|uniref:PCMD domain-containing protein n=1 Tax=Bacteroides sp. TaxID=29523 RepID=UPI00260BFEB7|nr:PCMD domain-containing protein [Bacteroides sp.]MDD3038702.1 PCMD domain-containing protein [Bacteroides sp.]